MFKIKKLVIKIAIGILNFVYLPFKLLKTNNKITYISRQSNTPSIDFKLLYSKMEELDKSVSQVVLTKKIEKGLLAKLDYAFHILVQMYHLATSKVVVIDTYIIPVSVLKHKKSLKVIQIWHALGAVKKFGYQTLDKKEGSSQTVANAMKMHNNYDIITCTSKVTAEIFEQAFNTSIDKIRVVGMPRVDNILSKDNNNNILKENPNYANKPTILYIPTFRKNGTIDFKDMLKKIDKKKYNLIIKLHPLDNTPVPKQYIAKGDFTTYDLMKFADYIITDYSATAIEASLLQKPLFLYVYDIDEYNKTRGLNIDLTVELKNSTFKDIKDIIKIIKNNSYDYETLKKFRNKYIETYDKDNTLAVCNVIRECL